MTTEDFQGITEHCYREGCKNYVTGASDFCSPQCGEITPHKFEQIQGIMVNMCVHCGKWPIHHIHGLDKDLCTCDTCRKTVCKCPTGCHHD